MNKAEYVMVIPFVLKFAIGVGGSFGRGAITSRSGEHFTGPCSAPALFVLEGGNIGFQLGGQATDFVLLVMNPKGRIRSSAARGNSLPTTLLLPHQKRGCGKAIHSRLEAGTPTLPPRTIPLAFSSSP